MPWVDKNKCIGCELCIQKCPVGAISLKNGKAKIDMKKCIRCGKCHKICPQEAVGHDNEKIPQEIEKNIKKVNQLLKFYKTEKERQNFLKRMIKHFNKEKEVTEKTIEEINKLIQK